MCVYICVHLSAHTLIDTYTCVWRSKIDIICFPQLLSTVFFKIKFFYWSGLLASPREGPAYPVQHHLTFYVGVCMERTDHLAPFISPMLKLLQLIFVVIQLSAHHLLNHLKSQFYQHTARYSIK